MKLSFTSKEEEKIQWELKRNDTARKMHFLPPLLEARGAPEGAECDTTINYSSNSFNNDCSRATSHNLSSCSAAGSNNFQEPLMKQIPNAEISGFLQHYLKRKNVNLSERKKALLESARERWNLQPILPFVFADQIHYRNLTNKNDASCTIKLTGDFSIDNPPIHPCLGKQEKAFNCCIDFFSGKPYFCKLLLNEDKTKVQVIGEASSTKIWSADLASISHAVVKWNYSVLLFQIENGESICVDFMCPSEIRSAVSLLELLLKQARPGTFSVELQNESVAFWSAFVKLWQPFLRLSAKTEILFIKPLYFEESCMLMSNSSLQTEKAGYLMYCWSNNTKVWSAGYFIIRTGELLQYSNQYPNSSETAPFLVLSLNTKDGCQGFARDLKSSRPYTFEIKFCDKCLLLSAASESDASAWLTSLSNSLVVSNNLNEKPIAAGILVTRENIFIFQTSRLHETIASSSLETLTTMVSPHADSRFCLIELNCREAFEGTGDWVLHFQSQCSLNEFLEILSSLHVPREKLPEKIATILCSQSDNLWPLWVHRS